MADQTHGDGSHPTDGTVSAPRVRRDANGRVLPGSVLNPEGPGKHRDTLRAILERFGSSRDGRSRKTRNEKLALALWNLALGKTTNEVTSQLSAIRYLFDQLEGKATERIEVTAQERRPLVVVLPPGVDEQPPALSTPDADASEAQYTLVDEPDSTETDLPTPTPTDTP